MSSPRFSTAVLVSISVAVVFTLLLARASGGADAETIQTITPVQLFERLQQPQAPLVVDVRELEEYEEAHIAGVLLKPLATIDTLDVDRDAEIVLVCRSDRRSAIAYQRLAERGFTRLWNMEGGMLEWQEHGLPTVTR
jgi:rhodanese-related sulfurtransferase